MLTPNEEAALAELEWELTAPHTLEEIAAYLGCSRRTVARIEASALAKLKETAPAEWEEGLSNPTTLVRRNGDIFDSDGRTPRNERER